MDDLKIIQCTFAEMGPFVEFAARGGWNVGLSDQDFLFRVDPTAYLMALNGNEVVGTVAAVKYGNDFGFLGYHLVRVDMQKKGLGKALLTEALGRLGARTVGLNCLETQTDYYKQFGFLPDHSIIQFEGETDSKLPDTQGLTSPFMVPFEKLQAFDQKIFPYDRKQFLSCWHAQPMSMLMGKLVGDEYKGYAMFRPCRTGHRIAPLLSDDAQTAEELLNFLLGNLKQGSKYYLDVPDRNIEAVKLAEKLKMRRCGELIRMYSPCPPSVCVERIFSLPAIEIG